MPEGDSVFFTARRTHQALAGKTLVRADFRHPALATVDVAGRTVLGVHSVGKHLLTRFSGDLSLHSHLRMDGSWQVYRPGQRWRRPGHHARVVFDVEDAQVVGFQVHDLSVLRTGREDSVVGHLGPDLLDQAWTEAHEERAIAALTADPDRELGLALLDQRVMAGVGNVYKVEVAFLLGVTPWTAVSEVDGQRVVRLARKLLRANAWRPERSTTGELARNRRYWVYERHRSGCFRCGGPVRCAWQGADVTRRHTWFCPRCQDGPAPAANAPR
ncbi:DNA glycosylase [Amycolatopsis antarctica]|uniref:DNA-(apurinic or apyrimidinic site) lyase n=1 Tax=Amycolatopsis antarctica TaxID=1854586 RepID=A0A263D8T3_9PSEU|nr:DNA-formamidopyrimidine glycosylase family protein [Amycolatopsis antarctica]OZM74418.1 DNA glycosylase [Amycolatopsis antarctica]